MYTDAVAFTVFRSVRFGYRIDLISVRVASLRCTDAAGSLQCSAHRTRLSVERPYLVVAVAAAVLFVVDDMYRSRRKKSPSTDASGTAIDPP